MTNLVWLDGKAPDCTTDRGWLHALCEPWSLERRYGYTNQTEPVRDDRIGWREQSSVGYYLDFGPLRRFCPSAYNPTGNVHAVCYWTSAGRYCLTVKDAKAWILREAAQVRPEVHIQQERPL